MLALLIAIPIIAGFLAWLRERWSRWISMGALILDGALVLGLWNSQGSGRWIAENEWAWIPQWGVHFHLGMDGLSLLLVLLSVFLGILSVLASWTGIRERVGFFHLNLMLVLAGIIGVFLSLDLFLFYFFWELMLVPMYFLIAIWGHENRTYAAMKFFIFTQASGLLMLVAILGLYFVHGKTGAYTFDYPHLLGTKLSGTMSFWLMLGFFVAFAVKLPVVPLHTWLPDAHTEAPTAGSVILAGLLLKTGGYGLLRFVLPLFASSAERVAPVAMALGVVGILYGSVMAYGQTDLKRMVAYTSVSHLGFVLLGIFSGNKLALQGAVMQMICHGISTGGLFIIVGAIQDRIHTRDLTRMGGFWSVAPRLGASGMFFALASLGVPGLGNFIGEFLVLLGTYRTNVTFSVFASLGFIVSTVYSLWLVQTVLHGKKPQGLVIADFSRREVAMMGVMMLALLWLGIYPRQVFDAASPSLAEVTHDYR